MADPNLPTVRDDGSIDTGDRPGWVWVKDTTTGHRFDVRSTRPLRYGVELVPGVPVNYGKTARAAKAFVGKDGEAATPAAKPAEVASGDEARAESIADEQAAEQAVPVEQAPDVNETARPDTAFTVATAAKTQTPPGAQTAVAKQAENFDRSSATASTAKADPQNSGTAGSTTNDTKSAKAKPPRA